MPDTHQELGDVIEDRKCHRDAAKGICTLLVATALISGYLSGVHALRTHRTPSAAEEYSRQALSHSKMEKAIYYASWPGRQVAYLLHEQD